MPLPANEVFFVRAHADVIPPPPTLQEHAQRVAEEWDISTTTLFNLIESESEWNPEAIGDDGKARGLVQIHKDYFPTVSDEEAFDVDFSLNFAAQAIKEGWEWKWSVCNCYAMVKTLIPQLPAMKDVRPNWSEPAVGGVVILYYTSNQTGEIIKHIAYITKVTSTGFYVFEGNFKPCLVGTRFIHKNDPHIVDYWVRG